MENSKRPPSAAELLKKIQEMEQRQAYIKQEIYKLKLSAYLSKLGHETTSSHQLTVGRPCVLMEPLAMKLTEIQYLNILHSIGQAVHVYDLKQRIIFWNRAAENLYGYTATEAYGKTPTELLVEPAYTLVGNYVEERTTHGDNWSGVFPLTTKYGKRLMAICAVTPYRDEYRRQLAAICVSCDSRQYQQVSQTIFAPTMIPTARHERDSQQPQHISTASKISEFVSKVKSKLMRGDYYKDHDDSAFYECEGSTPWGHIGSSLFRTLFAMDTEEHHAGKQMIDPSEESKNKWRNLKTLYSTDEERVIKYGILRPWKANDREVESTHAKHGHSGWPRYNFSQAHEYGHLECHKIEVLERYFSSIQVSGESWTSNSINKVDGESDELDLDYDSL